MSGEDKFCTQCGAKVSVDAQFCQQCGTPVAGSEAEDKRNKMYQEYESMVKEGRMTWITFLLVVYAVPAMIMAIWVLFDINALTDTIWNNDEFKQWVLSHPDVTIDTVRSYITYMGYMILASGAFTVVSLICVIKRNWWIVAVVSCFIAAFLCIGSLFGIIVGFLVSWLIYAARDSFVDQQDKTEI